jgi:hypothetical protein
MNWIENETPNDWGFPTKHYHGKKASIAQWLWEDYVVPQLIQYGYGTPSQLIVRDDVWIPPSPTKSTLNPLNNNWNCNIACNCWNTKSSEPLVRQWLPLLQIIQYRFRNPYHPRHPKMFIQEFINEFNTNSIDKRNKRNNNKITGSCSLKRLWDSTPVLFLVLNTEWDKDSSSRGVQDRDAIDNGECKFIR